MSAKRHSKRSQPPFNPKDKRKTAAKGSPEALQRAKISDGRKKSAKEMVATRVARLLGTGGALQAGERILVQEMYRGLQACAEIAAELKSKPNYWRAFVEHDFWNTVAGGRPKNTEAHRNNALHYTIRMFTHGSSKLAYDYKKPVMILLDEGVPIKQLEDELKKRGGLNGVMKSARKAKISKAAASDWDVEEVELDDLDDGDERETVRPKPSSSSKQSVETASRSSPRVAYDGEDTGKPFQIFTDGKKGWPKIMKHAKVGAVFSLCVECRRTGTDFFVTNVSEIDD